MSGCANNHVNIEGVYQFDARGISKRFRHAAIFGAISALTPGEAMRFVNNHNPLPLIEQLLVHYGDRIEVNYVNKDPGAIVIDLKIVQ
jgi:uncharacterized protein (DUF2249 family)